MKIGEARTVAELLEAMRREELAERTGRSSRCAKLRVQTRRLLHRWAVTP